MADHKVRPEEIRRRRKRKMWNQEQLADASGISLGQISRIEQGRHNPHLSSVAKIAEALGVDPNELLIWKDVPDTPGLTEENVEKLEQRKREIRERESEASRERDSQSGDRV